MGLELDASIIDEAAGRALGALPPKFEYIGILIYTIW